MHTLKVIKQREVMIKWHYIFICKNKTLDTFEWCCVNHLLLQCTKDLIFTLQTIAFTCKTESCTMTCTMDLFTFIHLSIFNLVPKKSIWYTVYVAIYTDSVANWFLLHCLSSSLRQNIIASFIQRDRFCSRKIFYHGQMSNNKL